VGSTAIDVQIDSLPGLSGVMVRTSLPECASNVRSRPLLSPKYAVRSGRTVERP